MAVSSPDMSTETPASDELEARVRALEAETVAAREALEAATPTLPEVPASDAQRDRAVSPLVPTASRNARRGHAHARDTTGQRLGILTVK